MNTYRRTLQGLLLYLFIANRGGAQYTSSSCVSTYTPDIYDVKRVWLQKPQTTRYFGNTQNTQATTSYTPSSTWTATRVNLIPRNYVTSRDNAWSSNYVSTLPASSCTQYTTTPNVITPVTRTSNRITTQPMVTPLALASTVTQLPTVFSTPSVLSTSLPATSTVQTELPFSPLTTTSVPGPVFSPVFSTPSVLSTSVPLTTKIQPQPPFSPLTTTSVPGPVFSPLFSTPSVLSTSVPLTTKMQLQLPFSPLITTSVPGPILSPAFSTPSVLSTSLPTTSTVQTHLPLSPVITTPNTVLPQGLLPLNVNGVSVPAVNSLGNFKVFANPKIIETAIPISSPQKSTTVGKGTEPFLANPSLGLRIGLPNSNILAKSLAIDLKTDNRPSNSIQTNILKPVESSIILKHPEILPKCDKTSEISNSNAVSLNFKNKGSEPNINAESLKCGDEKNNRISEIKDKGPSIHGGNNVDIKNNAILRPDHYIYPNTPRAKHIHACLAGYDGEIFDIIKDIKTTTGNEIEVHFYLFHKCRFNYLSSHMSTIKILQEKLSKFHHYICLDKKYVESYDAKKDCWYIEKLIIIPSFKNDFDMLSGNLKIKDFGKICQATTKNENDRGFQPLALEIEEKVNTKNVEEIHNLIDKEKTQAVCFWDIKKNYDNGLKGDMLIAVSNQDSGKDSEQHYVALENNNEHEIPLMAEDLNLAQKTKFCEITSDKKPNNEKFSDKLNNNYDIKYTDLEGEQVKIPNFGYVKQNYVEMTPFKKEIEGYSIQEYLPQTAQNNENAISGKHSDPSTYTAVNSIQNVPGQQPPISYFAINDGRNIPGKDKFTFNTNNVQIPHGTTYYPWSQYDNQHLLKHCQDISQPYYVNTGQTYAAPKYNHIYSNFPTTNSKYDIVVSNTRKSKAVASGYGDMLSNNVYDKSQTNFQSYGPYKVSEASAPKLDITDDTTEKQNAYNKVSYITNLLDDNISLNSTKDKLNRINYTINDGWHKNYDIFISNNLTYKLRDEYPPRNQLEYDVIFSNHARDKDEISADSIPEPKNRTKPANSALSSPLEVKALPYKIVIPDDIHFLTETEESKFIPDFTVAPVAKTAHNFIPHTPTGIEVALQKRTRQNLASPFFPAQRRFKVPQSDMPWVIQNGNYVSPQYDSVMSNFSPEVTPNTEPEHSQYTKENSTPIPYTTQQIPSPKNYVSAPYIPNWTKADNRANDEPKNKNVDLIISNLLPRNTKDSMTQSKPIYNSLNYYTVVSNTPGQNGKETTDTSTNTKKDKPYDTVTTGGNLNIVNVPYNSADEIVIEPKTDISIHPFLKNSKTPSTRWHIDILSNNIKDGNKSSKLPKTLNYDTVMSNVKSNDKVKYTEMNPDTYYCSKSNNVLNYEIVPYNTKQLNKKEIFDEVVSNNPVTKKNLADNIHHKAYIINQNVLAKNFVNEDSKLGSIASSPSKYSIVVPQTENKSTFEIFSNQPNQNKEIRTETSLEAPLKTMPLSIVPVSTLHIAKPEEKYTIASYPTPKQAYKTVFSNIKTDSSNKRPNGDKTKGDAKPDNFLTTNIKSDFASPLRSENFVSYTPDAEVLVKQKGGDIEASNLNNGVKMSNEQPLKDYEIIPSYTLPKKNIYYTILSNQPLTENIQNALYYTEPKYEDNKLVTRVNQAPIAPTSQPEVLKFDTGIPTLKLIQPRYTNVSIDLPLKSVNRRPTLRKEIPDHLMITPQNVFQKLRSQIGSDEAKPEYDEHISNSGSKDSTKGVKEVQPLRDDNKYETITSYTQPAVEITPVSENNNRVAKDDKLNFASPGESTPQNKAVTQNNLKETNFITVDGSYETPTTITTKNGKPISIWQASRLTNPITEEDVDIVKTYSKPVQKQLNDEYVFSNLAELTPKDTNFKTTGNSVGPLPPTPYKYPYTQSPVGINTYSHGNEQFLTPEKVDNTISVLSYTNAAPNDASKPYTSVAPQNYKPISLGKVPEVFIKATYIDQLQKDKRNNQLVPSYRIRAFEDKANEDYDVFISNHGAEKHLVPIYETNNNANVKLYDPVTTYIDGNAIPKASRQKNKQQHEIIDAYTKLPVKTNDQFTVTSKNIPLNGDFDIFTSNAKSDYIKMKNAASKLIPSSNILNKVVIPEKLPARKGKEVFDEVNYYSEPTYNKLRQSDNYKSILPNNGIPQQMYETPEIGVTDKVQVSSVPEKQIYDVFTTNDKTKKPKAINYGTYLSNDNTPMQNNFNTQNELFETVDSYSVPKYKSYDIFSSFEKPTATGDYESMSLTRNTTTPKQIKESTLNGDVLQKDKSYSTPKYRNYDVVTSNVVSNRPNQISLAKNEVFDNVDFYSTPNAILISNDNLPEKDNYKTIVSNNQPIEKMNESSVKPDGFDKVDTYSTPKYDNFDVFTSNNNPSNFVDIAKNYKTSNLKNEPTVKTELFDKVDFYSAPIGQNYDVILSNNKPSNYFPEIVSNIKQKNVIPVKTEVFDRVDRYSIPKYDHFDVYTSENKPINPSPEDFNTKVKNAKTPKQINFTSLKAGGFDKIDFYATPKGEYYDVVTSYNEPKNGIAEIVPKLVLNYEKFTSKNKNEASRPTSTNENAVKADVYDTVDAFSSPNVLNNDVFTSSNKSPLINDLKTILSDGQKDKQNESPVKGEEFNKVDFYSVPTNRNNDVFTLPNNLQPIGDYKMIVSNNKIRPQINKAPRDVYSDPKYQNRDVFTPDYKLATVGDCNTVLANNKSPDRNNITPVNKELFDKVNTAPRYQKYNIFISNNKPIDPRTIVTDKKPPNQIYVTPEAGEVYNQAHYYFTPKAHKYEHIPSNNRGVSKPELLSYLSNLPLAKKVFQEKDIFDVITPYSKSDDDIISTSGQIIPETTPKDVKTKLDDFVSNSEPSKYIEVKPIGASKMPKYNKCEFSKEVEPEGYIKVKPSQRYDSYISNTPPRLDKAFDIITAYTKPEITDNLKYVKDPLKPSNGITNNYDTITSNTPLLYKKPEFFEQNTVSPLTSPRTEREKAIDATHASYAPRKVLDFDIIPSYTRPEDTANSRYTLPDPTPLKPVGIKPNYDSYLSNTPLLKPKSGVEASTINSKDIKSKFSPIATTPNTNKVTPSQNYDSFISNTPTQLDKSAFDAITSYTTPNLQTDYVMAEMAPMKTQKDTYGRYKPKTQYGKDEIKVGTADQTDLLKERVFLPSTISVNTEPDYVAGKIIQPTINTVKPNYDTFVSNTPFLKSIKPKSYIDVTENAEKIPDTYSSCFDANNEDPKSFTSPVKTTPQAKENFDFISSYTKPLEIVRSKPIYDKSKYDTVTSNYNKPNNDVNFNCDENPITSKNNFIPNPEKVKINSPTVNENVEYYTPDDFYKNICFKKDENQNTTFDELKNCIVKTISSSPALKKNLHNIKTSVDLPLEPLVIGNMVIDHSNSKTIKTPDKNIDLKSVVIKMKVLKPKLVLTPEEVMVTNFIPIVNFNEKRDQNTIQDIAKQIVEKAYSEPILLSDRFSELDPYVVIRKELKDLHEGKAFIWPAVYKDDGWYKPTTTQ